MWPFKKTLRLKFVPKKDMTPYELAVILQPAMYSIRPKGHLSDESFRLVRRHFEEMS